MCEYNGWTNYQTWNTNLWPMNELIPYRYIQAHKPLTPASARSLMEALYPHGTPDMHGPQDYDKVNWQEIADAWNES